jgi:hypothetical protein
VDSDAAGSINGSDGIPDRVLYRDVRSTAVSSGGQILLGQGAGNTCGVDPTGAGYRCSYLFQPDGSLVRQTGSRIGLAPNGSFVGGNGETLREGKLLQLLPQLDRYAANVIAHFDVSEAFVPFFEGKYVRTDVVGTGNSGPAFYHRRSLRASGTEQPVHVDPGPFGPDVAAAGTRQRRAEPADERCPHADAAG